MKAPPLDLVCKWIVDAWAAVSTETIRKSFKVCGITVALDGSEDQEISVFKAGRGCEGGLDMLKDAMVEADQKMEEDPYEEEHLLVDSDDDDEVVEEDEINED